MIPEMDAFIHSCNDAAQRAAQPFVSLPTILQELAARLGQLEREQDTTTDKITRLEAEHDKLSLENGELKARFDQVERSQANNSMGLNDHLREAREHLIKTANDSATRIYNLVKQEAEVMSNSLNGEREARRAAIELLSGKHVELVNTVCALQHDMDMIKDKNNGSEVAKFIGPSPIGPKIQHDDIRTSSSFRGNATPLVASSHDNEVDLRRDVPRSHAPPFLGQFPPTSQLSNALQTSTPFHQAFQANRLVAQTPVDNASHPLEPALASSTEGPNLVRTVNTDDVAMSEMVADATKGRQTPVSAHPITVHGVRKSVMQSRPTSNLSQGLVATSVPMAEQQPYAIPASTISQDKQTTNTGGSVPDTIARNDLHPTQKMGLPAFSWLTIYGFLDKPAPTATKAVPKMQQDLFRSMWQSYGEPGLLKDYARQCLDKGLTGDEYGSMESGEPSGLARKDARGFKRSADGEAADLPVDSLPAPKRVTFSSGPSYQGQLPKASKVPVINAHDAATTQSQKNIEWTEVMTGPLIPRKTVRKQVRTAESIDSAASSTEPRNTNKIETTVAADTVAGEKRKRKPNSKAQNLGKTPKTFAASNMETNAEISDNDTPPTQRQKTGKQVHKTPNVKASRKRVSVMPIIAVPEPLDNDEEDDEPQMQKDVKGLLLEEAPSETEEAVTSPTVASLGFVFRKTKEQAKNDGLGPKEKAEKRVSFQMPD